MPSVGQQPRPSRRTCIRRHVSGASAASWATRCRPVQPAMSAADMAARLQAAARQWYERRPIARGVASLVPISAAATPASSTSYQTGNSTTSRPSAAARSRVGRDDAAGAPGDSCEQMHVRRAHARAGNSRRLRPAPSTMRRPVPRSASRGSAQNAGRQVGTVGVEQAHRPRSLSRAAPAPRAAGSGRSLARSAAWARCRPRAQAACPARSRRRTAPPRRRRIGDPSRRSARPRAARRDVGCHVAQERGAHAGGLLGRQRRAQPRLRPAGLRRFCHHARSRNGRPDPPSRSDPLNQL